MGLYECWICTDFRYLQTVRVQVGAGSGVQAEQEIIRLFQPVRMLGKPYAVCYLSAKDISC
jgi:hypothetical protein